MKRSPLKRKKGIAHKSAKTKERDRLRSTFVREQLIKFPWCKAGGVIAVESNSRHGHLQQRAASEIHEPLTRARGGSILDPENSLAVCRECHRWIHDHPERSHALGLLVHSWEG